MALDKITRGIIADDAIDSTKIEAGAISASDLGITHLSVGETAPSSPFVGQRWYRASTAVTYQYTNDGTSSFWLDVSTGGIGTSASRGVDYVGDTDPIPTHNGGSATLSVGQVYYNREANRHFVCTTATTNSNVWSGRFAGAGGIETNYLNGGYYYRVHTFLSTATFSVDSAVTADYLVIAGGGGGGGQRSGGGGAGGFRSATGLSVAAGIYDITIGAGGTGGIYDGNSGHLGVNGGNSIFSTITATGGGAGGGGQNVGSFNNGQAGGSGGGGGTNGGTAGGSTAYGNDGGAQTGGGNTNAAGGGGAGAASTDTGSGTTGTAGGAGEGNSYRYNSQRTYAGGGGGGSHGGNAGAGGTGGGGAGSALTKGSDGVPNTGSGGGGAGNSGVGGAGGSGIVVIRYKLNP